MKMWDYAMIRRVRSITSRVTVAVADLDVSAIPRDDYIELMERRALHNLRLALPAGVMIDPEDVRYWEEPREVPDHNGDGITCLAVCGRWSPHTTAIELLGGPVDGQRYVLAQDAIGQPFRVLQPMTDPVWSAPVAPFPTSVEVRTLTYNLIGWNERESIWVYGPDKC